ncbi:Hypoxia up-regulated protein 1 [Psilocybe cubensis]|uniref:Actin-like ATPase domain-containing protein n=2 Tax=Psilocybe cubensis TaxID=181762 RepID=A0A8H8CFX6_PSICU|nr:Hypoxia up-regulated protein 1 [Psilocybe cubensis]KAH9477088.1 Hypoxia up-regulated protein 1 [Psilocybe cubensis]
MRLLTLWSLVSLSLLTYLPQYSLASVLAIDYGNDFIKASLMKPGVPFDVILNKDSKRKISSVVAWKKGDRLFGQDAFNLASRFPSDTFSSLKLLQASPFDAPVVSYYGKVSTSDVVESDRKTVSLVQSDGTEWAVEELVAMEFAYIKHLAELVANEKVSDVIVTVPPYFSQFERDAIADAIEISGLRTLALINDGTAVAVNYAMTRTFSTPEYHIIYDAGASGIRATVASFTTASDPKTGASGTHIAVAGVGYDRDLGGIELDRRMREILIEAFNTKHRRNIREDKRGMAKLWKEAQRVKAILSANTEVISNIESLAWDIDFKTKVTRAQFEAACEDLKGEFAKPIESALKNAGLTLDNITSVILMGGSTRTPMIQAALKAAVGEDKIATNVNTDEAAVLGAALHGASLSRQFKTKNIKVSDIGVHDVQVSYFAAPTSSNTRPRSITTLIFPAGSKVGTKKVLTFKRKEDFSLFLDYKNPVAPGFPTRMLEVDLGNVTEAIANLTERGATDPVVKATLTLSESGFVSVTDAIAFGEIKDESLTGKLKGLFGGGSSSSDEATQSAENVPPRDSDTASPSSSAAAETPSSSAAAEKDKKPAVPVENTIPLTISVRFTTIPPMTVDEKKKARGRLRAIDLEESAKSRREEARNTFESYLYRLRDLLNDESADTPFKKCSQSSERQAISEKLDESFAWLFDRGDLAETSQFLDKRIALETLEKPIIHRYQEIEAFPQALNNSQMWNWSTRLFLQEARANLTAELAADLPSKWTKDELDGLEKTLREHEAWLSEWVEKQKSVKSNEDPVIETTEMKARAKVLETHLQKLWKRKVPKVIKKKPKPTATTSAETPVETDGAAGEEENGEEAPFNEGAGEEDQVPLQEDDRPHDEL